MMNLLKMDQTLNPTIAAMHQLERHKGNDVPDETSQTVNSIPYLQSDVQNAASLARSLYNDQSANYQSREQIYNSLKDQYTTNSGYSDLFITPEGQVTTLDGLAKNQDDISIGLLRANGYSDDELADYLGKLGYKRQAQQRTDFDGLNAAVDARLAEQDEDGGFSYYPGSTVVPYSQTTEDALAAIEGRARSGSDLDRAADDLALASLRGDYLDNNPYLDDVVNNATQDITDQYLNSVVPSLNSTFARSGRFGSGAQAMASGDAISEYLDSIGRTSSNIRYQNYNDERNRQGLYASLAPSLAANDYADMERLAGVGSAREELDRAYLQEDIDRYYYNQDVPGALLDQYISRINSLNGGYGSSTSIGTNPAAYAPSGGGLGGAIGGAASGLGIATGLSGAGVIGSGATGALAGIGGPLGLGIVGLGALGGLFG